MTENTKKTEKRSARLKRVRRAFPYFIVTLGVIALAFFGSRDKFFVDGSGVDMSALAQNNYSASADQIAEMYMVTTLASSMRTSAAAVSKINYDSITSAISYTASTTTEKLDKPTVVDTSHLGVGVVVYVVKPGDTIASIAQKYAKAGVTEIMIRWSNNFKRSKQVRPGEKIYVPGRSGFVHKVKKGENINTIAIKYQSTVEEIITANNLELSGGVKAGMVILVPDGELPENERPDYVAPVATRAGSSFYSYRAQYSAGNRYAYGWCTWYAWSRRRDLPGNMGNANRWAVNARRAGFPVNKSPRAGAIFQNSSGWYGHVGYVESVNGDGTITVSDMNYAGRWGRVTVRKVSKSEWSRWNFIQRK